MSQNSTRPVGPLVIDIENITKDYVMGEETVRALRGVSLQIHRNEYIAIMGPSGSGKSTLMNMLGCLDTPTSGRYEFNGKNVAEMNDDNQRDLEPLSGGRDPRQHPVHLDGVGELKNHFVDDTLNSNRARHRSHVCVWRHLWNEALRIKLPKLIVADPAG